MVLEIMHQCLMKSSIFRLLQNAGNFGRAKLVLQIDMLELIFLHELYRHLNGLVVICCGLRVGRDLYLCACTFVHGRKCGEPALGLVV